MRRLTAMLGAVGLMAAAAVILLPDPAQAIPAFARK